MPHYSEFSHILRRHWGAATLVKAVVAGGHGDDLICPCRSVERES